MILTALSLASGAWLSALTGGFLALIATVGMVSILHGKLQHVPELTLKLWAGGIVLLQSKMDFSAT